jgi:hypothetical protein
MAPMKRYRVWEANRKVFLWPENWLEPDLHIRQEVSHFLASAFACTASAVRSPI